MWIALLPPLNQEFMLIDLVDTHSRFGTTLRLVLQPNNRPKIISHSAISDLVACQSSESETREADWASLALDWSSELKPFNGREVVVPLRYSPASKLVSRTSASFLSQ